MNVTIHYVSISRVLGGISDLVPYCVN